jgi:uncharacterized peroxidase-related enzyme
MAHISLLGANATLVDVYRRYPAMAAPVLALGEAAFTLTGELSRVECELLGSYISSLNRCDYCRHIHSEAAVVCGLDRTMLPERAEPPTYGGPRWAPIFAYVQILALRPAEVETAHVAAVREAGWSEEVVVQLATLVGFFSVLNRLADGLGLAGDAAFYAAAGQRLGTISYRGTAELLGLTPPASGHQE